MKTVISIALTVNRQLRGSATKAVELPFVIPPGVELEMSVWESPKRAMSVSVNVDMPEATQVFVSVGLEPHSDEASLLASVDMYKGHGWEVSGI